MGAFSGARLRYYDLLASPGLLPDGNPREDVWGPHRTIEETLYLENIIKIETVELPLDLFGSTNSTSKNRFSVSTEPYKQGGPVILLDVGESSAFPDDFQHVARFRNKKLQLRPVATEYGGAMIQWEHRFHGKSTPYNITLDTPASAFEFLTTEQALADVAKFAWNFGRHELPNVDLTPASTPWIFIGGSYPGMRAAFMRQFHPSTIHVGYASSAPV